MVIFTTTDYKGRQVTLDSESWSHIVAGHPEMKNNLTPIKNTINDPHFVYKSSRYENRELFFGLRPESTYPKLYTEVVVEYTDNNNDKTGKVKTSWVTPKVIGVSEGGLLYVRSKI